MPTNLWPWRSWYSSSLCWPLCGLVRPSLIFRGFQVGLGPYWAVWARQSSRVPSKNWDQGHSRKLKIEDTVSACHSSCCPTPCWWPASPTVGRGQSPLWPCKDDSILDLEGPKPRHKSLIWNTFLHKWRISSQELGNDEALPVFQYHLGKMGSKLKIWNYIIIKNILFSIQIFSYFHCVILNVQVQVLILYFGKISWGGQRGQHNEEEYQDLHGQRFVGI